jgi:release factor glutamine methyltransferase
VSNPPYVETLAGLQPELGHEPVTALVGEGLHERIAAQANAPAVVFEVGDDQAPAVAAVLRRNGFPRVTVTRDLAGVDRVVDGMR